MKPVIGIIATPYVNKDGSKIYQISDKMVKWVLKYGGIPISIIPTQIISFYDNKISDIKDMTEYEKDSLIKIINMCDGIIKPGAFRIYNHERFIYEYATENNIPFLGICAGCQLMASYKKEKIENEKNIDSSHYSEEEYVHSVKINKDSKLYKILGKEEIMVNSFHNVHMKDNGLLKINAISSDGIIEGIENEDKDFNIGLQWHPELTSFDDINSQKIFTAFLKACEHYHENKY